MIRNIIMYLCNLLKFLVLLLFMNNVFAYEVGSDTKLKIPRFVSLKSDDANLRIGPSKKYPIILKFVNKNYPLEILDEYKDWRYVTDFKKNIGWIHKSLLKGNRSGILVNKSNKKFSDVYLYPNYKIIGRIYDGNLLNIYKCKINWCLIEINGHKGWIRKLNIWGVYNSEIYKDSWLQFIQEMYWEQIIFAVNAYNYLFDSSR